MSSEKQDRHVLDELLAQSLVRAQSAEPIGERRNGGLRPPGGGRVGEPGRSPVQAPPAGARVDPEASQQAGDARQARRWEDLPAAEELQIPEVRAPAPRGANAAVATRRAAQAEQSPPQERLGRRHGGDLRPPGSRWEEVQVGRGPLALHLGRGAIEERLGELSARIEELQGRLRRQRERNGELRQAMRETKDELAAQSRALRQARAEEQEARQAVTQLRAELAPLRAHERALQGELESERLRRTRAELELERLRGSLTTLGPLLSGIERATEAVRAADSQAAEGAVELQGRRQGAGIDARSAEPQRAPAGAGAAGQQKPSAEQPSGAAGLTAELRAASTAPHLHGVTAQGQAVPAGPAHGGPGRAEAEGPHAGASGGIVRVIADAVEHWRGPGPRPAH